MKKPCEICGTIFKAKQSNHKYCSDKCRHEGWKRYINEYIKRRYREEPEFRKKMLERGKKRRLLKRDEINEYARNWQKRRKWTVLCHYGGNPPKCACCGEETYEFLAIDHIKGKWSQDEIKQHRHHSSNRLFRWIIDAGFPEGFQILCHNCNSALGFFGFCPHKHPEKSYHGPDFRKGLSSNI